MFESLRTAFSSLARKVVDRFRRAQPPTTLVDGTSSMPPEPPQPLAGLARIRAAFKVKAFVRRLQKRIAEERVRALEHTGNRHERRRATSILYRHRSKGRAIKPRLRAKVADPLYRSMKEQLARQQLVARKAERRAVNQGAKKVRRRHALLQQLREAATALETLARSFPKAAEQMQAHFKTQGAGHVFARQGDSYVYLGETQGPLVLEERKAA